MITITIILVIFATFIILRQPFISQKPPFSVSEFSYINSQLRYQIVLLCTAFFVIGAAFFLNKENFLTFFSIGDIFAPAEGVAWLDIEKGESWLKIGANFGIIITLATSLFIAALMRKAQASMRPFLKYFPWVVLFSLTNSFAEEAIYRLGVIVPLYGILDAGSIALLSGILFGVPHYRGVPNGIVGVIMAGFLGWFLAKSVIETGGIGWAWSIHFLQDIVIISAILATEYKKIHGKAKGEIE